MIASDHGLVLRTYPLRESSRIVGFLGREHGRLRLVANGSRGAGNRFGASFEIGNEVDLVFSLPPGRDLGTVREASLRQAWIAGTTRIEMVATGLAVVELLDRVLPEGAGDPGLLAAALAALAAQRQSTDRGGALMAFLGFELQLLLHLGLQPALAGCARCGGTVAAGAWVDLRAGTLSCSSCGGALGDRDGGRVRLDGEAALALVELAANRTPRDTSADVRRRVGLALHQLLATHVERYRYPLALALLKKVDNGSVGTVAPGSAADDLETP